MIAPYMSDPCSTASFSGGLAPSDMTANSQSLGKVTQTLQYQTNTAEESGMVTTCGTYSVELTPSLSYLSVSQSGALAPDGVTLFYDTLIIDQS
jgi:hypothetical protein